jgi:hypothetical protein
MAMDKELERIARECEKCARCMTLILPAQRVSNASSVGSGRYSPRHEDPEDCVDGLLRLVEKQPPWKGAEHLMTRRPSVMDTYDCVTGQFEPTGR